MKNLRSKPVVLLIAFTGLIITVFQLARSLDRAGTDIRAEWVTISLPNPPAPLPDPPVMAALEVSR